MNNDFILLIRIDFRQLGARLFLPRERKTRPRSLPAAATGCPYDPHAEAQQFVKFKLEEPLENTKGAQSSRECEQPEHECTCNIQNSDDLYNNLVGPLRSLVSRLGSTRSIRSVLDVQTVRTAKLPS